MVRLRPVETRDAPSVHQVDSSREALRRWMAWYRDDYDLAAATAWIQHAIATAGAGRGFHFGIIDADDELLGVISLEDVEPESGRAMLGYWMVTGATGRRLGRQAIAQVVRWAREQPNIVTLWAVVADANLASRRVLEVNGFHQTRSRDTDGRGDVPLIYELELRAGTT